MLDKVGEFDQIDVVADDGTSVPDLRSSIQSALPKGIEAVKSSDVADEQAKQLQEALGFFRTALLVFAFIALFVGAFIIFNTFSIIVAQRTREMALLRAVGASRRQVMTSVVVEAFLTGLIASALGLLAGIAIALGLKGLLSAFGVDLPSTSLQLEPRTIVVAFVVGTVVTVVSSILPARRAARVAPVQALRESADSASGSLRRRLIIGLILTAAAVAALLYGLFGNQSNAGSLIGLGAAATFVGIAILLPLGSRPLAAVIGAPIRRLGIQGKLGRENAMRNPRRTASTASALMIGLGLVAMVTVLASSLKASLNLTIEKALKADLVLTTSSQTPFSPDVAERVREVDGVAAVSQFRQGGFRVKGSTAFVTAVDPATIDDVASLELSSEAIQGLEDGKIVVFDDVMADENWKVGDTIPTAFATVGKVPLVIGGTFSENSLIGTNYVISLDTYEQVFQQQLDAFVMVKLDPGADATAVTASVVAATTEFGNIEVQDQTAFREQQAGFIDQLLGLISALLCVRHPDRALRHREHARPVDLRTHPRAGAPASGRDEPQTGQADDPVGVGHHRDHRCAPRRRDRRVLRLRLAAGAREPRRDRAGHPGRLVGRLRDPGRAGRGAGRDLARAPRRQAERAGVHLVRVGRRRPISWPACRT